MPWFDHSCLEMFRKLCCVFILVSACEIRVSGDLTCRDDSGKPVDWYIIYKLPQLVDNRDPNIANGTGYVYLGQTDSSWNFSKKSIENKECAAGNTLKPIYDDPTEQSRFFLLYNDEDPNGPVSLIRGHTKGVVAFDGSSGFWLVHSVPKFPPHSNTSAYSYPKSGHKYGQTFLCITMDISQALNLSKLLYYNDAVVYDYFLPDDYANKFPLFDAVTKKKHVEQSPWNLTLTLKSRENYTFQAFAKYKNYDRDLYSEFIAPNLASSLYAETWLNGPGKLDSECSNEYIVENVRRIEFPLMKVTFNSSYDHSKYALAIDGAMAWTCIGDINRMKSQKRRGGGSVCINNHTVWKSYKELINEVENCI